MSLARWLDIWRRFTGRGTYPHEFAFLLINPLRGLILSPDDLVDRLHLDADSWVLEIGPGPGYFSAGVARVVSQGHLALLDVQSEMLAKARRRLRRAGVANVSFTRANGVALPFRAGSFDVVFLVAVLGEVPDPAACVASIRDVLRPGGLLSVSELPGDPDALRATDVEGIAEPRGFELLEVVPVSRGFTANFRRRQD